MDKSRRLANTQLWLPNTRQARVYSKAAGKQVQLGMQCCVSYLLRGQFWSWYWTGFSEFKFILPARSTRAASPRTSECAPANLSQCRCHVRPVQETTAHAFEGSHSFYCSVPPLCASLLNSSGEGTTMSGCKEGSRAGLRQPIVATYQSDSVGVRNFQSSLLKFLHYTSN